MARVTVEDCVDKVPNRFELVMLAAHRAREISAGADITVDRDNDKNPVVSLREIADETQSADELRERLIESNRVDIEQGVTSIDTTVQALQGIIAKIKDMVGKIALMNELTMEQNKTSDAVFDDTEKIQNMSREMRNATSELVAGSNEVQNAMDSINTSAENFTRSSVELRESADELQTAVKRMEQKITEDQQKMMGM